MVERLIARAAQATSLRHWLDVVLMAALFAAVAVPFGLYADVLAFGRPDDSPALVPFALFVFFVPSLCEEVVFRGLLLPRVQDRGFLPWAGLSLVAYVAWHPLAAILFMPAARALFFDPYFLIIVTALGLTLSAIVWRTGSLLAAILVHWLVVLAWKFFFGGPIWALPS